MGRSQPHQYQVMVSALETNGRNSTVHLFLFNHSAKVHSTKNYKERCCSTALHCHFIREARRQTSGLNLLIPHYINLFSFKLNPLTFTKHFTQTTSLMNGAPFTFHLKHQTYSEMTEVKACSMSIWKYYEI